MSQTTVFYAWQSDSDEATNRYFIRDAATAAIRSLKKDMPVQEAPRLDHDTAGVPGTPEIASTIFQKIDRCSVFIADVSFVGSAKSADGREKQLPNPNVLIELGYALARHGYQRVIMVLNRESGTPDSLPFDLRGRRHPVAYSLSTKGKEEVEGAMKLLSEQLKVAIRAVLDSAPRADRETLETERRAGLADSLRSRRDSFIQKVLSGSFYKFSADGGVVSLMLVPERPLIPLLELGAPEARRLRLSLIYGTTSDLQIRGRAITAVAEDSTGRVFSAAELQPDGVLSAADGLLLHRDDPRELSEKYRTTVVGAIPSGALEHCLVKAIGSNVSLLRHLGIKGPIHVMLGLHRIMNFIMALNDIEMHFRLKPPVCEMNEIMPDPVTIAEESAALPDEQIASAMRPAFDMVWRDCGLAGSANFDEHGRWRPK